MEKREYSPGLLIELDNKFATRLATLQMRISYHCPNVPLQSRF